MGRFNFISSPLMKPRVFIGSSAESISVAYAIQENLQYDCDATVWSQGMFNLSSTAMEDLLVVADKSDFAIFVFNSDDVLISRETKWASVRDNIIFELGLFIGKLGRRKVFYLKPLNIELKIPSDLLGIIPGFYDEKRTDNLVSALGPFCNQIRDILKSFKYENLKSLEDEPIEIRKIVIDKPSCWEFKLGSAILKNHFRIIEQKYLNINKGIKFHQVKHLDFEQSVSMMQGMLSELGRLISIISNILTKEFDPAFGPPGVSGNVDDIKKFCDMLEDFGNELIGWESRVNQSVFPPELDEIKSRMKGWTAPFYNTLIKIPIELDKLVQHIESGSKEDFKIDLKIDAADNADDVCQMLDALKAKRNAGHRSS